MSTIFLDNPSNAQEQKQKQEQEQGEKIEHWEHQGKVYARYPMAPAELYKDLREKWKHEDELINRRVTWLLTSQGLFFTTYGILANHRIAWDKGLEADRVSHWFKAFSPFSLAELILVACAMAFVFYLLTAIKAAIDAMAALKARFRVHQKAHRIWAGMRLDVAKGTSRKGAMPAMLMAWICLLSWLAIVLYELIRVVGPFFSKSIPVI